MRIGAGLTATKLRIEGVRFDIWQIKRGKELLVEFTDHKRRLFVQGHFITIKELFAIAKAMSRLKRDSFHAKGMKSMTKLQRKGKK